MEEIIYTVDYITKNEIDKKAYGFIYITTNLINGKKYIGQRKFSCGWKYYLGSGMVLTRVIKKHGRNIFSRNIVDFALNQESLNDLEVKWINHYNATNSQNFYNIASGGVGGFYNLSSGKSIAEIEDWKNKLKHIGRQRIGSNNPMSRKVLCLNTGEIFDSITEASNSYNIGRKNISFCLAGKSCSAGKINNKPAMWEYYVGQNYNSNIIDYMIDKAIDKKSRKHRNKKIICINSMTSYRSITEAYRETGISRTAINNCVVGKSKSAGKHPTTGERLKWMYYEDYIAQQEQEQTAV